MGDARNTKCIIVFFSIVKNTIERFDGDKKEDAITTSSTET